MIIKCPHAHVNLKLIIHLDSLALIMTGDKVFLAVAFSILTVIVLYEIIYIFFFKDEKKKKIEGDGDLKAAAAVESGTAVVVQPKPLGYSEPSTHKYEMCPSPVIALPETTERTAVPEPQSTATPIHVTPLEPAEVIHTPLPRKNSFPKAPTIVVSSEV